MIMNNESARLVVGDQVPISVRTAQDPTNSDVFVSTVEFRDTGVIFEVTPRINSSGSVTLNINQEVSTVGQTDASTGNPIISQRTVNSAVAVDSGETIALGGLFETRNTRGSAGIPGLAKKPVLGGLFGRKSGTKGKTELLVLITPRIVNNTMDARRVTRSLRERVENIKLDDASLSGEINVPSLKTSNSAAISSRGNVADAAGLDREALAAPVQTTDLPVSGQGAAGGSGAYYAYLGAFSSEDAARSHWSKLSGSYAALFSGASPRFPKNGKLTGVAVGPMSRNEADKICTTVKSDCYTGKAN
jgi:general secretion pathway protein D